MSRRRGSCRGSTEPAGASLSRNGPAPPTLCPVSFIPRSRLSFAMRPLSPACSITRGVASLASMTLLEFLPGSTPTRIVPAQLLPRVRGRPLFVAVRPHVAPPGRRGSVARGRRLLRGAPLLLLGLLRLLGGSH